MRPSASKSRLFSWSASSSRRFTEFFFSSRRRHTRCLSDWSSHVCSSDLSYQQTHRTVSQICCPLYQAEPTIGYLGETFRGRPARSVVSVEATLQLVGGFALGHAGQDFIVRSEERRVGKECSVP